VTDGVRVIRSGSVDHADQAGAVDEILDAFPLLDLRELQP
jgi:hypothetical protein